MARIQKSRVATFDVRLMASARRKDDKAAKFSCDRCGDTFTRKFNLKRVFFLFRLPRRTSTLTEHPKITLTRTSAASRSPASHAGEPSCDRRTCCVMQENVECQLLRELSHWLTVADFQPRQEAKQIFQYLLRPHLRRHWRFCLIS